jgi:hypothetical protein
MREPAANFALHPTRTRNLLRPENVTMWRADSRELVVAYPRVTKPECNLN